MTNEHAKLRQEIDEQMRSLMDLKARLNRLEAALAPGAGAPSVVDSAPSRRGFLRLAGAAAAGAAATMVVSAESAAATDGSAIIQGVNNSGVLQTTVTNGSTSGSDPADTAALRGIGPANRVGLLGQSTGSASAGVQGSSDTGYGIYGTSTSGYALYSGGNGRIGMAVHVVAVPPTSGDYRIGDLVLDSSGNLAVCVTAGTPGEWRKIGGRSTSGQLHLLPTPLRAYDSRPGEPAATGGDGPIVAVSPTSPTSRVVSLLNGTDNGVSKPAVPAGALGALFNLTITGTSGFGYLSVIAAGTAWSRASTTNWVSSGETIPGFVTSAVNASAQIAVLCPYNSTNFLIDVVGYYR